MQASRPANLLADVRHVLPVTVCDVTFKGTLERIDDFNIALMDAGGDYRSFARKGNVPKVALRDPLKQHYDMLSKYSDADIHNLTAWLTTLK